MMDKFWDKVDKNGPKILKTKCWVWTAFKNKLGYGHFKAKGFSPYAHRASWEINIGPIPVGMLVCHKCDNPSCIRPDHLFIGTNADNKRDCVSKDRHYKGGNPPHFFGEEHPNHVLTEKEVLEIKSKYIKKYGSCTALAREYGVDRSCIYLIVTGKNWGWLK